MKEPTLSRRIVPAAIAALVVIADRAAKIHIQHRMNSYDSIPVIPDWVRIVHTENPGAAFGFLAEGNPAVRAAVLIGASALVLVFVAVSLCGRNSTLSGRLTRLGLALILGGALGNLWDRILRGTVTDFFEIYHGAWSFPAFNVADSAIAVGACLMLLDLLRPHGKSLKDHAGYVHE